MRPGFSTADVQITVAETVGVEQRGEFYEATGALRDMVPNHVFALLSMVAMEPPTGFDAASSEDATQHRHDNIRQEDDGNKRRLLDSNGARGEERDANRRVQRDADQAAYSENSPDFGSRPACGGDKVNTYEWTKTATNVSQEEVNGAQLAVDA
jgi:hypothetical protein